MLSSHGPTPRFDRVPGGRRRFEPPRGSWHPPGKPGRASAASWRASEAAILACQAPGRARNAGRRPREIRGQGASPRRLSRMAESPPPTRSWLDRALGVVERVQATPCRTPPRCS
ncbi:MAG: hypothetical protein MZV70_42625 [Desulfobacterales bacterium]|nr:hypothetical protein [Desulfobacterales bacterium]